MKSLRRRREHQHTQIREELTALEGKVNAMEIRLGTLEREKGIFKPSPTEILGAKK